MANNYPLSIDEPETFYPLHPLVCDHCYLVQLEQYNSPTEIFSDYAYFSSYSTTCLQKAKSFAHAMIDRCQLGEQSLVVEVGSNDGYLLRHFLDRKIPVLGIEPAQNVAKVAQQDGIQTISEFFGLESARTIAPKQKADLLIGNNVLAHTPYLNDFVAGLKVLLNEGGMITMEFPHLMRLLEGNQFDTIYHEHFSYFSFKTLTKVFGKHGLRLFDVEEISAHGGSLRIHGCHVNDSDYPDTKRTTKILQDEASARLDSLDPYQLFGERVSKVKMQILEFLINAKKHGKKIAGYSAPAKATTLLNYCGIKNDYIEYVVDRSEHKQGHFIPGTHIPIYHPDTVRETQPDYLIVLGWNLLDEIMNSMDYIRQWGGKFVTLIPEVKVHE